MVSACSTGTDIQPDESISTTTQAIINTNEPELTEPIETIPTPATPTLPDFPIISPENASQLDKILQLGEGIISGIKWSPDQSVFAISSSIGVSIFDTKSWNQLNVLEIGSHENIEFSPSGELIAVDAYGQIKIFAIDDGKLLDVFDGRNAVFSKTGGILAYSARDSVILKNIKDSSVLMELQESNVSLRCLEFSSDESYIAGGDYDGNVWVWRVSDGKLLRKFSGHTGPITDITFSKSGATIASYAIYDTARLWNIDNGKLVQVYEGVGGYGEKDIEVVFPSYSDLMATWSITTGGPINVWNFNDGSLLHTFELEHMSGGVGEVAISPSGDIISIDDAWEMKSWQLPGGDPLPSFDAGDVAKMQFSPDGDTLTLIMRDGLVQFWDVHEGRLLHEILGFAQSASGGSQEIADFEISPDGSYLATGSQNGPVKVWRVADGSLAHILGFGDNIEISPDGEWLASMGGGSDYIPVWRVSNGERVHLLKDHTFYIGDISFSPDGSMLATATWSDEEIMIWSMSDGSKIKELGGHVGGVMDLEFSPTEETLASISMGDYKVRLWDVSEGRVINQLDESVRILSFSPDGQIFATGNTSGSISLREATSGDLIAELEGHPAIEGMEAIIDGLSFSPDGELLVSHSEFIGLRLWRVSDGKLLQELMYGTKPVFSPDGKLIAFGDQLIDIHSGLSVGQIEEDIIAFDREGRRLFTISDGTIRVWGVVRNLDESEPPSILKGHTSFITSLSFSDDGKLLATGGDDNLINIWNISDGKLLRTIVDHTDQITRLLFSPDGSILVSQSADGIIAYWSVENGERLYWLENQCTPAGFSPDGKKLYCTFNGEIKIIEEGLKESLSGFTSVLYGLSIKLSPNGDTLALIPRRDPLSIELWDLDNGKQKIVIDPKQVLDSPDSFMIAPPPEFSPDGTILAVPLFPFGMSLWSVDTGQLIMILEGEYFGAWFSKDGNYLSSYIWVGDTNESYIKTWDITRDYISWTTEISDECSSLEISDTILACGVHKGEVYLIDILQQHR